MSGGKRETLDHLERVARLHAEYLDAIQDFAASERARLRYTGAATVTAGLITRAKGDSQTLRGIHGDLGGRGRNRS